MKQQIKETLYSVAEDILEKLAFILPFFVLYDWML